MHRECGFTVLDLLITLVVAAILAGIAIPNFTTLIRSQRAVATVNELAAALNYARHTAITRNSDVTLCKSADGKQCNHALASWNAGWLIFQNLGHHSPPQVGAGEPILRMHGPLAPTVRVISNRDSFTFHPMGKRSVNGTLLYCSEDGKHDRALIINVTGRIRLSDQPGTDTSLDCS